MSEICALRVNTTVCTDRCLAIQRLVNPILIVVTTLIVGTETSQCSRDILANRRTTTLLIAVRNVWFIYCATRVNPKRGVVGFKPISASMISLDGPLGPGLLFISE